jgi:methionine-rich copper-binding protein CopC
MRFLSPIAMLLGCLAASPASAHAYLTTAEPAAGSVVAAPPAKLVMHFTEALAVPFCTVTVSDSAGKTFNTAKPETIPGHDDSLSVPLDITAPGKYTVTWHALSADTHKTQGHFTFTVSQ